MVAPLLRPFHSHNENKNARRFLPAASSRPRGHPHGESSGDVFFLQGSWLRSEFDFYRLSATCLCGLREPFESFGQGQGRSGITSHISPDRARHRRGRQETTLEPLLPLPFFLQLLKVLASPGARAGTGGSLGRIFPLEGSYALSLNMGADMPLRQLSIRVLFKEPQ